jgi:single-strand DNA-binding protein
LTRSPACQGQRHLNQTRISIHNGPDSSRAPIRYLVHGRIHYAKWTDATGTDRYGCEIIAEKVDFLSRPKAGEGEDPELIDREDQFAG